MNNAPTTQRRSATIRRHAERYLRERATKVDIYPSCQLLLLV